MAQTDRFYFWRAFYDALMMLDNDTQRGEFVRGMCQWAFDGAQPTFSDKMLQFGFTNIRDQLTESIDIGRKMAERGRKSGAARRKKASGEQCSEQCSNERNGSDRNGTDLDSTSVESGASRSAPDGAALAPVETDPSIGEIPPCPEGGA